MTSELEFHCQRDIRDCNILYFTEAWRSQDLPDDLPSGSYPVFRTDEQRTLVNLKVEECATDHKQMVWPQEHLYFVSILFSLSRAHLHHLLAILSAPGVFVSYYCRRIRSSTSWHYKHRLWWVTTTISDRLVTWLIRGEMTMYNAASYNQWRCRNKVGT